MAFTAADIFSQAQALLNNSTVYTDAKLLPFLVLAYDDLKLELIIRNSPPIEEKSDAISVLAGDYPVLTAPSDMIIPLSLEERVVGQGEDDYNQMKELDFIKLNLPRIESLLYWSWQENRIKFRGATQERQVRVYYLKELTAPSGGASSLDIEVYFKRFLSSRTAALAAGMAGQDWDRATALQEDANRCLGLATGITTKRQQAMPIRQKSYGYTRRIKRFGRIV